MTTIPFKAGPALDTDSFYSIRERLCLDGCKWDPQIGDLCILAPFPIILECSAVELLSSTAEALTQEILDSEAELISRPDLLARLGLPGSIVRTLIKHPSAQESCSRIMRFDFHWTTNGWQISEVNSDVPGGFTEASDFPRLLSSFFPDLEPIGDPTHAWVQSIITNRTSDSPIARLAAPSFTEDQQVIAYLGKALAQAGVASYNCVPSQLTWRDGHAFLSTSYFKGPVSAIVRFYQGEWLAALPKKTQWEQLFNTRQIPIANPGRAIISETKRFSLVRDRLLVKTNALKEFFPETRELTEVSWQTDDAWMVKAALSNCGDGVIIRSLLTSEDWDTQRRLILRRPRDWVAQKRFESVPIDTPAGPLHVCFGVYSVDAKATGIYGRAAARPLIDYTAFDVAILKENSV